MAGSTVSVWHWIASLVNLVIFNFYICAWFLCPNYAPMVFENRLISEFCFFDWFWPHPSGVINWFAGDEDEMLLEMDRYPFSMIKTHHRSSTVPFDVR